MVGLFFGFMRTRLLLTLFFLTSVSTAGVYRWQDADGVIQYTDRPVKDAEELRISGDENDSSQDETIPGDSVTDPEDRPNDGYSEFQLSEPAPNQTFRTDAGEVNIAILLKPALAQGHEIQLIVDGRPLKDKFSSTQLMLSAVGRGSHTLQAKIVDAQGETYALTQVVNFHIRKAPLSGEDSIAPPSE